MRGRHGAACPRAPCTFRERAVHTVHVLHLGNGPTTGLPHIPQSDGTHVKGEVPRRCTNLWASHTHEYTDCMGSKRTPTVSVHVGAALVSRGVAELSPSPKGGRSSLSQHA